MVIDLLEVVIGVKWCGARPEGLRTGWESCGVVVDTVPDRRKPRLYWNCANFLLNDSRTAVGELPSPVD
jgi:hypothetical protein